MFKIEEDSATSIYFGIQDSDENTWITSLTKYVEICASNDEISKEHADHFTRMICIKICIKDSHVVSQVLAIPNIHMCMPSRNFFDLLVEAAQKSEQVAPKICSYLIEKFVIQYPEYKDKLMSFVIRHLYAFKKVKLPEIDDLEH